MSRPANPSWIVPVFATDATYPAGSDAWAGTPTKVIFSGATGGFVPGQSAAAQFMNYHFNAAYTVEQASKDSLVNLYNAVGQGNISAWRESYPDPTTSQANKRCRRARYDAVSRRWLVSANNASSVPTLYSSADGGQSWTAIAYTSTPTMIPTIGVNPSGLSVMVDGGANKAWYCAANSNTLTQVTLGGLTGTNNQFHYGPVWFAPTSQFVAFGGRTAPSNGYALIKGAGNVNWTDISASLPAPYNSGGIDWTTYDASPTRFAAAAEFTDNNQYFTSDDLVTFTARTLTGLPGTGWSIRVIKYSSNDSLWIAMAKNASTNEIRTYTSPDAITWTLKGTIATEYGLPRDLSFSGAMWVANMSFNYSTPALREGCMFSLDQGATWRPVDAGLPSDSNSWQWGGVSTDGGRRFILTSNYSLLISTYAMGMAPALT